MNSQHEQWGLQHEQLARLVADLQARRGGLYLSTHTHVCMYMNSVNNEQFIGETEVAGERPTVH